MKVQNIAIKFPQNDVENMDKLISSGMFISRSDLVREGTRGLMMEAQKKKVDVDTYVKFMYDEGTFKDPSLNMLAKLHIKLAISPETAINGFSDNELRLLERLLKHPFKPIEEVKGKYYLTENGIDAAEGFLEGLFHFKKMLK